MGGLIDLSHRLDEALGISEQTEDLEPYWGENEVQRIFGHPEFIDQVSRKGIKLSGEPKFIGKGAHARSYLWGGYVVKVTDDFEDADSSEESMQHPSEHLAKVYDVIDVTRRHAASNLYVIIQEFIPEKLSERERDLANAVSYAMPFRPGAIAYDELYNMTMKELKRVYDKGLGAFPETTQDTMFVRELLLSIIRVSQETNINLADVHGGNFGRKDGRIIFFDLGLSAPIDKYRFAGKRLRRKFELPKDEDEEEA